MEGSKQNIADVPVLHSNNIKQVKSFADDVLQSHTFVTMAAPAGGYELIAVNKKTGLVDERLVRIFPTPESVDKFVKEMYAAKI